MDGPNSGAGVPRVDHAWSARSMAHRPLGTEGAASDPVRRARPCRTASAVLVSSQSQLVPVANAD